MATYNVTTNFGAKDNLASGDVAKKIKGSEFTTEFTNISTAVNSKADTTVVNAVTTTANAALPKSGGAMTGAITTNSTFDGVDIATRDGVLTTTTTTANAALPKAGGTMSGAIAMGTSKITGAGDPTDAQDVATKAYVDTAVSDIATNTTNIATNTTNIATNTADIATNATAIATKADTTTVNLKANTADVLPLTGGTLSGPLTLRPLASVHPVLSLVSSDIDILDNDVIGSVTFGGIDSLSIPPTSASIKGEATDTWTSSGFGTDLVFSVSSNSVTTGTNLERMRITFDGTQFTSIAATHSPSIQFYNGSLLAGKINTHQAGGDGYLSIGTQVAGLRFVDFGASKTITPFNVQFNVDSDNLVDFGSNSARFVDIYAINGTIQTSDQNEKQDIEELSEAETRVAVACKGLLRKFRWKSAVEEKGDEARTHFGIIAQDLQAAFEAEGLDAGNYAMFISTTWTNEDGEEQTRLGVRYSELLAFIIGGI